ncbi:Copiatype Polyprotein [Phytophthora palmivora]|uniref:Copiatype Polyprotein n=1 Tax=Phytophthora palmivora TaxID=4796 RepID=A0A2P4XC03_9STRA|nr:Copiatype Polyprotein [Phytophthora palmivora]
MQEKFFKDLVTNRRILFETMETNMIFAPRDVSETSDTSFRYHEAIVMLMYLATSTRPDLVFPLGQLSRLIANHRQTGTVNYGVTYSRYHQSNNEVVVDGFRDSDWANDSEHRKSPTGFAFLVVGVRYHECL